MRVVKREQLLTLPMMVTVRRTTALPISAEAAFALAQKPATFAYVVRGVMRVPALAAVPEGFAQPGVVASGRLWWLGVLPSWTHHLRVVTLGAGEILTAPSTAARSAPGTTG